MSDKSTPNENKTEFEKALNEFEEAVEQLEGILEFIPEQTNSQKSNAANTKEVIELIDRTLEYSELQGFKIYKEQLKIIDSANVQYRDISMQERSLKVFVDCIKEQASKVEQSHVDGFLTFINDYMDKQNGK